MVESELPYRGYRIWRLILTTCRQGEAAPFVDNGFTQDREGHRYISKIFLLTPWRRNRQRALVIGWEK